MQLVLLLALDVLLVGELLVLGKAISSWIRPSCWNSTSSGGELHVWGRVQLVLLLALDVLLVGELLVLGAATSSWNRPSCWNSASSGGELHV